MQESYSKKFNLLIHGPEESNDTVWETHESTLETIHKFLQEGLSINDPTFRKLIDYHRLPQPPTFRNSMKVNRPVVIKLANANNGRIIFSKWQSRKHYNEARKSQNKRPHYIREHLPQ